MDDLPEIFSELLENLIDGAERALGGLLVKLGAKAALKRKRTSSSAARDSDTTGGES